MKIGNIMLKMEKNIKNSNAQVTPPKHRGEKTDRNAPHFYHCDVSLLEMTYFIFLKIRDNILRHTNLMAIGQEMTIYIYSSTLLV